MDKQSVRVATGVDLKPPGCCGGFRGKLRTTKLVFVASGVCCDHI